jgi:hypothetical protein
LEINFVGATLDPHLAVADEAAEEETREIEFDLMGTAAGFCDIAFQLGSPWFAVREVGQSEV